MYCGAHAVQHSSPSWMPIPRSLQQETSLLDWPHAPGTLCSLPIAFNSDDGLLTNMYITTVVLVAILTLKTLTTKVYKSSLSNLLEISFLLNLIVLSATLHYLKGNSSRDHILCECTSISISVSVVVFIGILSYHAYLQMNKIKIFTSFKKCHPC